MASCQDCRWWTKEWATVSAREGACMISRTEVAADGLTRPVVRNTPFRALANSGHVAAVLVTDLDFVCAQFAPR